MKRLRLPPGDALWLSASPRRAIAESLVAAVSVILLATRLGTILFVARALAINYTLILFSGPFLGLWCAARMRQRDPIWRELPGDGASGVVMALVPATLTWLMAYFMSERHDSAPRTLYVLHFSLPVTAVSAVALAGFTLEFIGLRLGVRLWRHWNRLRHTRLRWALTHAHLTVVVLGVGTLGLLLFAVSLQSPGSLPLRVLPTLFMLAILTLLALAVVLPPSALFSYLFARRTTRRLELLAGATNQLRAGDYRVRVPVDGADEVAQLQVNFNAMAADLERAVADLQDERDRVALLLQARRELVANVSHELRTPLATLRGYLESALTHWDTTRADTLRHDLAVMDRETGHLQTLIDDLFTLARAEVGKLDLRCEAIDVGQLARNVVEVSAPVLWQSSRVQLLVEVDKDVPLALADRGRVRQILYNLIHNAARHTSPGGIVVMEARAEDDAVALAVKDTGEGIAADELPLIWQRFYRGQGGQHPEGSTGLGLALVKEMTEAMGGSVDVSSTPGEGSVFTVRLPHAARTERQDRRMPTPAAPLGRDVPEPLRSASVV